MALDLLKIQVQMAIVGATAQSLAMPDSVATMGVAGFARAAILVTAIEATFSALKGGASLLIGEIGDDKAEESGTVQNVPGGTYVPQRSAGKYDVIGGDDGQFYRSVPYIGPASTGIVTTPTLMGEQGSELVVSAPDLSLLQRHINYPLVINAINDARSGVVPQRAEGNYSQIPAKTIPTGDDNILREVRDLLLYLKTHGVKSPIVLSELQKKQELLSASQKIGSK